LKNTPTICIIDYGMGNLHSIVNALHKAEECNVIISNEKKDLDTADILLLPGVGAFKDAMINIRTLGLIEKLNDQVLKKNKHLIAICLGMQLIMETSEEGGLTSGLGWIPGNVTRLVVSQGYRVPHMGWNNIQIKKRDYLFECIEERPDFYFVHSYHVNCDEEYVIASCCYNHDFVAAIGEGNITAFQFHPEKSHKNGLRLLSNYINSIRGQL
jgi:imidazole glycerol-phosphate synthase subunit HisH